VAVTVDDASLLTTSDYVLQYNGANSYTLTRAVDGQTFNINAAGYPYTTTTDAGGTPLDGLSVTLSAAPTAGDRFLIRPTRNAARDFGVALTDARDVAAAAPLLGSSAVANTGSGQLASVSVTSATGLPLAGGNGAITLTYNSAALQFTVTDGSGVVGTVNYDPATDSGASLTLPAPLGFIDIQMTGAPANGDAYTIADNTSGQGDNRNALALAALQNARTLAGGTASYGDAYGQIVADVGSRTRSADIGRQAQLNVRDQAIAAREAVSGVNLDEEAANLVRFQQAYQAAAQVMSVSDTMFQTLLFVLRG
jgi:flagellar hook-associated protein 1 FlgK